MYQYCGLDTLKISRCVRASIGLPVNSEGQMTCTFSTKTLVLASLTRINFHCLYKVVPSFQETISLQAVSKVHFLRSKHSCHASQKKSTTIILIVIVKQMLQNQIMITGQLLPATLVLTMSMAHQIKMDTMKMDTLDILMSALVE